jgi:V/A-type H+-transporting ATPase subunit K
MKFILITNILVIICTIGVGAYIYGGTSVDKKFKNSSKYSIGVFAALMLLAVGLLVPDIVHAAEETASGSSGNGLGFIAAALCTGLATIGAGYAVGAVGSSALGAVSEDPKILGKTLIFVGLAEGIAIYGLIISILILGRL